MSPVLTAKMAVFGVIGFSVSGILPALACDDFTGSSVVVKKEVSSVDCEGVAGTTEGISDKFLDLFTQQQPEKEEKDDYWGEWAFNTENNPIVSGRLEKKVVGVGLWLPEELSETEDEMPYDEWLKSHGLQVSFAVGDKGKEPRVRFDYRWHEVHDGNLMFQVELPF